MSVILVETHKKIVGRMRKRAFFIHGLGVLLTLIVLFFPWISKLETDLIRAGFQAVRHHLVELESRYELLEVLRNKPLTVGQALQVADVLIEESRANKVPVHIVLGVISAESSFRPHAVSSEGARGMMQIMPVVWSEYVGSESLKGEGARHDPALNVRVGIRYLGDLFKQYGDWKKVLRVYGGFITKSPDRYVNVVLAKAERYRIRIGEGNGCSFSENPKVSE